MSLAPQIIGTLHGIARALRDDETGDADLYAVADALQEARNDVLGLALDVLTLREGRQLVLEHRAANIIPAERPAGGSPQSGGAA